MKTLIFALLFIFPFTVASFSQIKIVPKKVIYKRDTDVSYKKTFTVIHPKVSGLKNKNLARRIEANLSFEKSFDFFDNGLDDKYQLLDNAEYRVVYNKNDILNVILIIDVSAAHESHYEKSVAINTKTGERIRPEDIFIKAKFDKLAGVVDKLLQAEIQATLEEVNDDEDGLEAVKIQIGEDRKFEIADLAEFKIDERGVTFIYDYYFSHISRNYEPAGEFFLSYKQLKPFVRRDGVLGKFIK